MTFKQYPSFVESSTSLLRLAGPLMLGQLAVVGMTVTDIYMAGQVSSDSLAALQLGGSIWSLITLLIIGVMIGNSPIVGNYWGAGEKTKVQFQFQQGLWLALPIGLLACLAIFTSIVLLSYLDVSDEVYLIAKHYLLPFLITSLIFPLFFAFRSGIEGIGYTKPAMIFNCLAFVLNGFLDYILIFGKFGLPALGGAGAAWATLIVMLFLLSSMAIYARYGINLKSLRLYSNFSMPNWTAIRMILSLGIPISLSIAAEISFFALIPLMIAHLGTDVLGAHAIAINIDSLLYMLPLGIGQALTIKVAHAQGSNNPQATRQICITGFKLVFIIASVLACIKVLLGSHLAGSFSADPNVQLIATNLFLFAAVLGLFDSQQISCSCALRGFKDTRVPLMIQATAFWVIAFPIAYALALTDYFGAPLGVYGFWIGMTLAALIAAMGLFYRWHKVSNNAIALTSPLTQSDPI